MTWANVCRTYESKTLSHLEEIIQCIHALLFY
jgi:hypothetical protein